MIMKNFIKEIFNKKEFKEKDLLNLKIKRTDLLV